MAQLLVFFIAIAHDCWTWYGISRERQDIQISRASATSHFQLVIKKSFTTLRHIILTAELNQAEGSFQQLAAQNLAGPSPSARTI